MSTSKLQRQTSLLLSTHLGQYTIRENTRPAWLERLELDFYIEELRVGIEVQGQQHFAYTPHFHKSYADFLALKERDERKAWLCLHQGIQLRFVETGEDAIQLIEQLREIAIPTVLHPNRIAYEAQFDYPEPEPKQKGPSGPQYTPISRVAKRYVHKIESYRRMAEKANGTIAIRNLSKGISKYTQKLIRELGADQSKAVLQERGLS